MFVFIYVCAYVLCTHVYTYVGIYKFSINVFNFKTSELSDEYSQNITLVG